MKNIKYNFENKKVVITGGAAGIGFELVHSFLQAGASVTVWDYSESALEKARGELKEYASRLSTNSINVVDRSSLEKAAAQLSDIDILINNAGITRDKSFAKMTPEDWDLVIQTNLTGLFNVSRSLFEKFNSQSLHKRIINISSVVALYGNFGQANYVASKSGVIGLTKTLAKELGKKGFTVNAVAPGFIKTAMTSAMPAEVLQQMQSKVPVARLGQVADIANACLFLSSEESSYINGTVISVDGGVTF